VEQIFSWFVEIHFMSLSRPKPVHTAKFFSLTFAHSLLDVFMLSKQSRKEKFIESNCADCCSRANVYGTSQTSSA
jgi:hypothetical protein